MVEQRKLADEIVALEAERDDLAEGRRQLEAIGGGRSTLVEEARQRSKNLARLAAKAASADEENDEKEDDKTRATTTTRSPPPPPTTTTPDATIATTPGAHTAQRASARSAARRGDLRADEK